MLSDRNFNICLFLMQMLKEDQLTLKYKYDYVMIMKNFIITTITTIDSIIIVLVLNQFSILQKYDYSIS